jgi:radical SAM superfamily enzyme YgiQ (UPF0313 family)
VKIVLIRARGESGRETNVTGVYPPLGLAYLAAAVRRPGRDLVILDAEALGVPDPDLPAAIPAEAAILGVTATTLAWPAVRRLSAALAARFPRAVLVAGGPQLTAFPEDSLAASAFHAAVVGEGETSFADLVARVESGRPFDDVPGCAVRLPDGGVRVNRPIPWIEDLDALPFPALDLLPMSRYRSVMVREPFTTLVTARGCPFRCAFCSQVYSGDRWRARSPKNIVDEMERHVREFGAREIIFFDETFGVRRDDALEVCALIRERNLRVRWNARTRLDVLEPGLLRAMRQAGCYALHLGVESGSQRILDLMNKNTTLAKIEEAARLARNAGFSLHGYFMLAYPGETPAESEATLALARRLPLDWASFTLTIPNPATPLSELARRTGCVRDDFWQQYTRGTGPERIPLFVPAGGSEAALRRLKARAYARFYLRPATLARDAVFLARAGGLGRLARAGVLWLKELMR